MKKRNLQLLILLLPLCLIFSWFSCTNYPANVNETLDLAQENATELERVLKHYSNTGEKLKFEAACFLIGNMKYKFSYTENYVDLNGKPIHIDYSKYLNTQEVREALDSIGKQIPYIKKSDVIPDYTTIKANYLIKNIDQAFYLWKNVKWSKHLSFNDFCEYILPYRVLKEPLNNWRNELYEKYEYVIDSFVNDSVSLACEFLNSGLNDSIIFWPAYSLSLNQQIVDSIFISKKGKCPDLTILSTSCLRAIGIPVLIDQCFYWGNSGFGHIWNRLIIEDGSTVRFNSIDKTKPPGKYPNDAKMPKVFRMTYKNQKNSLFNLIKEKENIPTVFLKNNIKDVTEEYTNTADIKIKLQEPPLKGETYAYICVFNYGEWKPAYWGKIYKDSATFRNMGKDILYLPMYYRNKRLIPAAHPFIFKNDNSIKTLKPAFNESPTEFKNYTTKFNNSRKTLTITDSTKLTIKYWDGRWITTKDYQTTGNSIISKKIPKKCLYIIEPENPDFYFIRPFIIEKNQQKYY
ncbi:MAG: hypothetical protein PWQ06_803 [Anaerophaga sp.]|nr:hypothetical protein [Anaerophaga sp.]